MACHSRDEWAQLGVWIGDEVLPEQIAEDVKIFPGSRIGGRETSYRSGLHHWSRGTGHGGKLSVRAEGCLERRLFFGKHFSGWF